MQQIRRLKMKTRKDRHQKLFNEKFQKNTERIDRAAESKASQIIYDAYSRNRKRDGTSLMSNQELKEILSKNSLYIGTFYVPPKEINRTLRLNLEGVHMNLSRLEKQDNEDDCWAYGRDEFQKVFVIENDGERALCALTYDDSFCPYIIDIVDTTNLYLEGNIGRSII